MDKLRAIQSQLQAVTDRIATRLPTQRRHLAAFVCARKWQLSMLAKRRPQSLKQEVMDTLVKKMRMEIGAFEYSAKEQGELLTRALFQLDDILSHGDAEIKETRKALVLNIQAQLERADALKVSAARLKEFTECVIASFPTAAVEDKEMNEAEEEVAPESQVDPVTDKKMEAVEEESTNELRPLFDDKEVDKDASQPTKDVEVKLGADEAMEDASVDEEEQDEDSDDQEEGGKDEERKEDDEQKEGEEEEEEEDDDEGEEEEDDEGEEEEDDEGAKEEADIDIQSLPVWRPYYQIQQRADGMYIQAKLHGVDPRHISVEAVPQSGVVRISGFKLPTQKDLLLSRLSGQPTFGRFEIVERFPVHQLSLDHATQQLLQDGTLQVCLPFFVIQRPRFVRRVSPFQPHRLAVW